MRRSTRPSLHAAARMTSASPPVGDTGGRGCRYPVCTRLADGTQVLIRPIGPEDAAREQAFVRGLSAESRHFRFMNTLSELSPQLLERFTHPDPRREIALVALVQDRGNAPPAQAGPDQAGAEQVGVARCIQAAECGPGEFAIVVADRFQGKGLGHALMQELIDCARERGWPGIEGLILRNNHHMLELMHALGFEVTVSADDAQLRLARMALGEASRRHDAR